MAVIRQKTIVLDGEQGIKFKVGDEVILFERENDKTGEYHFDIITYNEGETDNSEKKSDSCTQNMWKKYHGLLSMDNEISVFGHGVRKVLKVSDIYERSARTYEKRQKVYKVVVGSDLHPEWK